MVALCSLRHGARKKKGRPPLSDAGIDREIDVDEPPGRDPHAIGIEPVVEPRRSRAPDRVEARRETEPISPLTVGHDPAGKLIAPRENQGDVLRRLTAGRLGDAHGCGRPSSDDSVEATSRRYPRPGCRRHY